MSRSFRQRPRVFWWNKNNCYYWIHANLQLWRFVFLDVELECLAHWREGSTNYMVARLNSDRNDRKTSDEESYRCFIYTNPSNNTWNLAQSSDAACNGLISVTEAARTFKMTQSKSSLPYTFFKELLKFILRFVIKSSNILTLIKCIHVCR